MWSLWICALLCVRLAFGADGRTETTPTNATDDGNSVLELVILHNNDMHSRFEQTDETYNVCSDEDAAKNRCYGGFARVRHVVNEYRKNTTRPVLFLNAGDTFSGSAWFVVHGNRIVSDFMNLLRPDAACLGNHEFDNGIDDLLPFLRTARFPLLAANLDLSAVPNITQVPTLQPSVVLTSPNGYRIGIVGYLTPDTLRMVPPMPMVRITDEVEAVNAESARLRASGILTIIALGHSGLPTDRRIATECPHIDLVIGGHDNTFMWSGKLPASIREQPTTDYPLVITQPATGKRVPVVQAYAFTKYLGILTLRIDCCTGRLQSFDGQVKLLDASVPQDNATLELLEHYRPAVDAFRRQIVGRTALPLTNTCRTLETNVGNLVTDALVHAHQLQHKSGGRNASSAHSWSDCSIALYQSGGIAEFAPTTTGNLTVADMMQLLPYDSSFSSVWLNGSELRGVLEHAVDGYREGCFDGGAGQLLQMSGLRVVYDLAQPTGRRVEEVRVLCTDCEVPEFVGLDEGRRYRVIVSEYLSRGGDGFAMLADKEHVLYADTVRTAVQQFILQTSPVHPAIEGRIRFVRRPRADPSNGASNTTFRWTGMIVLLNLIACVQFKNMK